MLQTGNRQQVRSQKGISPGGSVSSGWVWPKGQDEDGVITVPVFYWISWRYMHGGYCLAMAVACCIVAARILHRSSHRRWKLSAISFKISVLHARLCLLLTPTVSPSGNLAGRPGARPPLLTLQEHRTRVHKTKGTYSSLCALRKGFWAPYFWQKVHRWHCTTYTAHTFKNDFVTRKASTKHSSSPSGKEEGHSGIGRINRK